MNAWVGIRKYYRQGTEVKEGKQMSSIHPFMKL